MELPKLLRDKIVNFFISLPQINDKRTQQALIFNAGLDLQLQQQIVFGGSALQFVTELVTNLDKYGRLQDNRFALEAVLEAAKSYIGKDKQKYCNVLMKELQEIFQRSDNSRNDLQITPQQQVKNDSHQQYVYNKGSIEKQININHIEKIENWEM